MRNLLDKLLDLTKLYLLNISSLVCIYNLNLKIDYKKVIVILLNYHFTIINICIFNLNQLVLMTKEMKLLVLICNFD